MKAIIPKPKEFKDCRALAIMSSVEGSINNNVENLIKGKPLFAHFIGSSFLSHVWWDDSLLQWVAEVWNDEERKYYYISPNLEELRKEVVADFPTRPGDDKICNVLNEYFNGD